MRASATRIALLTAAALGLLPLAAAPAGASSAPFPPAGKVTITLHHGEDSTGEVHRTAALECFPMDGTHPRPYKACRALSRAGGDFTALRPVPGRLCTKEYDPITVVAHGTWRGEPTGFARTYGNECEAAAASGDVFDLTSRHPH